MAEIKAKAFAIVDVSTSTNNGSTSETYPGGGSSYYLYFFYANGANRESAYIQFDIAEVVRKKIKKVVLYQYLSSATINNGTSAGSSGYFFNVKDINNLRKLSTIVKSASSTIVKLNSLSVGFTTSVGWVMSDVTKAFDVSHSQDGVIGIFLNAPSAESTLRFSGFSTANAPYLNFTVEDLTALPPENLLPQNTQNPKAEITFSWWHAQNPEQVFDDPQIGSELTYWQEGGTSVTVVLDGTDNTYMIPANTFTEYKSVRFKVRTKTEYNGWGDYAETFFELGQTPPSQPTLLFPLNTSLDASSGAPLEWSYNSPYDTTPTRFDIRYRLDGDIWVDKYTEGQLSVMTEAITQQSKVEWQVRGYGALGDVGEWSETGLFYTIGAPERPVIVSVTNSNLATVYFSAHSMMAWELEILQAGAVVYISGNQPFIGSYSHKVDDFLKNGNYTARMRVTNEYGLVSEWGSLPFTINTIPPEPLKLTLNDDPTFFIRLRFNNSGGRVYIYRSEFYQNSYIRMAVTHENHFDDYTVRPKTRYKYFTRIVDDKGSFADSNIASGMLSFLHTTLAEADNPSKMLKFMYAMNNRPEKGISYSCEKSLMQFIGREYPVLQIGQHSEKRIAFSFYCSVEEFEHLEELSRSNKILLLRDWRVGALYGTIDGGISSARELKGTNVSFTFVVTDYDRQVGLT